MGSSSKEIIFKSVDLPLPDFPMMETKPLLEKDKEMLSKTRRSFPFSNLYFLVMFANRNNVNLKPPLSRVLYFNQT